MFIPTCVERFIHIAFPFCYKRIITTKAIMTMHCNHFMDTNNSDYNLLFINGPYQCISPVNACIPTQTNNPLILILLLCFFTPIVLITITSIYLRHRIIKTKNFFHSVKRNATEERKSNKAGRLAEIFKEQVKPTMSVFRVGGNDAVLDMISTVMASVASFIFLPTLWHIFSLRN